MSIGMKMESMTASFAGFMTVESFKMSRWFGGRGGMVKTRYPVRVESTVLVKVI